jgi:hypothetical protein
VVAIAPAVDNARNARLSMFSSLAPLFVGLEKKQIRASLRSGRLPCAEKRVVRFACGDNFAVRHAAQKARAPA